MIMSRADKPSPHSSPRLSRRSITPSVSSSNASSSVSSGSLQQPLDIYGQSFVPTTTVTVAAIQSAPLINSINGLTSNHNSETTKTNSTAVITLTTSISPSSCGGKSTTSTNCVASSSLSSPSASSSSSINHMSTPLMSSSASAQILNNNSKALNKVFSADLHDIHDQSTAPPLPPRKSAPIIDSAINRISKPNVIVLASSLVTLSNNLNVSSVVSRSSENITSCEFDVPKSDAPPIPKHNQAMMQINLIPPPPPPHSSTQTSSLVTTPEEDLEKIIVGPAETISGVIDTRPLEARKAIGPSNTSETNDKDLSTNEFNNIYQLKATKQQYLEPFLNSDNIPITTTTTDTSETVRNSTTKSISASFCKNNNSSSSSGGSRSSVFVDNGQLPTASSMLYENVTINNKDCNVPYENINLEYISRLMNEGYSKENVITALGISRNNIEMACDILHEFVSKNSA